MRRLAILTAALLGGVVLRARASVTLVQPVELDKRVDDVKDALNDPNANASSLSSLAQRMFDQAQDTHHLQVSGIGQWQRPESLTVAQGQEPDAQAALNEYTRIINREPPPPIVKNPTMQNRIEQDYAVFADLVGNDLVKKDEQGILPKNAAAAYVWNIAKSAKDGAVDGMMLAQPELMKAGEVLGEFILSTIGAHEMRHRAQHQESPEKLADEVQAEEIEAFRDQGALMAWEDPSGEKFMWLWTVTVERPGTPEFRVQYMKHLAQVRHAYAEGDAGLKELVKSLGYEDKPGTYQATQQAVQQPAAASPK